MASQADASGCFIFLTIVMGLVFWPVSLILILVVITVAFIGFLQGQAYSEYASKWEKLHASNPCVYSGKYGFISGVKTEGINIKLTIRPIDDLLDSSPEKIKTFSTKIIDGSFQHSMRQLFKQNSIEFLHGVSVELSAIEAALKCQQQLAWCLKAVNHLVKMSDQIDHALSIAIGNPLLEPSIPAMEIAKERITHESFRITQSREFSQETLEDIIEFLSVPEELRQATGVSELDTLISSHHDDLRSSFNELLEFNNEYVKLSQGISS